MKPCLWSFIAVAFFSLSVALAQQPTAPNDETQQLRSEVRRVEAEMDRLNLQLRQLKERLAKIEGQQLPANQLTPPFRFPINVERAMMGEATRRNAPPPLLDRGIFDNKNPGPPPSGPATPRK